MMHVVAGDGSMTKRELTATMADLMGRVDEGESFWFLIHAKPEPTTTDQALMAWLVENEVYFEIVGDDLKGADPIYVNAQDKHEVKRLAPKIVSLMNEKPEEGESADLLALFVSDDPDAEEDRWLNEVVQLVIEAGFPVLALNDGLVEIGLDEAGDEGEEDESAEDEPEPEPEPVKTVKKAAPKIAAAPDEPDEPDEVPAYTREALEQMELPDLKAIAADLGLTLPPRTRATTYVDHILGEAEGTPEAEITVALEGVSGVEAVTRNGDTALDVEMLADAVAERIFDRLREALNR
jgi:hypothetical protein